MANDVAEPIAADNVSDNTTELIGSKSWSRKIRKRAKELSGQLETGYMELARILYWVCDTKSKEYPFEPIFREWGYATFENYAQEELNLHYRKAYSLRRIWYRLEVELQGLSPEIKNRIILLGWTKVRELVKALTLANAEEWVQRASEEDYATLCVSVTKYLNALQRAQSTAVQEGKDPESVEPPLPPKEKYQHKHLFFGESQVPVIEAALEKAAGLAESTSDNNLFTMIATDFLATTIVGKGPDAKLRYLARLEQILGILIVAADPKTNEVVYGIETLQRLAGGPNASHQ